jgi:high-affinity iron transporter
MSQRKAGKPLVLALTMALLVALPVADSAAQERIRPAYTADYVAQMVDYVSRDYAGAVQDGVIIDQDEYVEQITVVEAALEISHQIKALAARQEILAELLGLIDLIKAKASNDAIKTHAQALRNRVLAAGGVQTAPVRWPSLAQGKQVFDGNCASCHGATGDGNGPAAQALDPKPADFLDRTRMAAVSPLSAFSAVKHGIRNTPMESFSELSDEDIWAVSFHLLSLRHRAEVRPVRPLDSLAAELWLKATASLPDDELMRALPGSAAERQRLLAALRSHSGERR